MTHQNSRLWVWTPCLLALTLISASSCGVERQVEDYHLTQLSQIRLTADNHPHGYGQSQCFFCHVQVNIHQVDRLNSGMLPSARALTEFSGISSCSGCHGNNGVQP